MIIRETKNVVVYFFGESFKEKIQILFSFISLTYFCTDQIFFTGLLVKFQEAIGSIIAITSNTIVHIK